jgi:uncharacterized SAM-binding protein YcdF (DUF218 family)
VATVVLFVRPGTDEPRRADAVVVLGPGLNGERLREGVRLMSEGYGDVLVVSKARDREWTAGDRLCSGKADFDVVCFQASPYTTRGEARAVADLASRNGWSSLLLVTSTYHVTRARILYSRCHSGRVDVVGENPHASIAQWTDRIVHEWGGLAYAEVAARTC